MGEGERADLLVVLAVFGDHLTKEADPVVDAGTILLLNQIVHLSLLRVVRWRAWGTIIWKREGEE